MDFRSMGVENEGYIDNITLALTNSTTDSPMYYITVKAVNGARMVSLANSSR